MRTVSLLALFAVSYPISVSADWLLLRNGERSEVRAVEIGDRAVVVVTLNGKNWSISTEVVDLPATRAANGMADSERLSPGWPRPPETKVNQPAPALATAPTPTPVAPAPRSETPVVEKPSRAEAAPERPLPRPPPMPPPPTRPSPAPLPIQRRDARLARVALFVNGVVGSTDLGVSEQRRYQLFNETATLDTSYRPSTRPGYEIGALVRLYGRFGVVTSAELSDRSPTASYQGLVPHPFFYDRFRAVSGDRNDLSWTERAIHVDPVMSFELGSRLTVDLFSGVSWFFTETDVIDDVLYEEVFPYESLFASGTTLRRVQRNPLGFNLGASTTLRLLGIVGLDFGIRYSRAGVRLELAEGRAIDYDAGGLRFGAGFRILIP